MNTEAKLKEFEKFGSILGLSRMKKLTDLLDKPQEGLNYIHIGGTNGKGSVSNFIYSVLKANGYKVGIFTSPFMKSFRESIIVDDEPMPEAELDANYAKIESAVAVMKEEGFESPTEFEVITALAFLYFADRSPDFVILEVGLGGTGDSTNIIDSPLYSVITSIALDHCNVLGDTVEKIAGEKAGIIKERVTVISNVSDSDAAKVIARDAYKKNAPLINADKYKAKVLESSVSGSRFSVDIDGINYPEMSISLVGEHQIKNAVCALTVIEQLRKKAMISLDRESTLEGLIRAKLPGRFEVIPRGDKPVIIMDGAHNGAGAVALRETIQKFYQGKKILTVFTLMKDKNSSEILKEFLKFSDEIIIAGILGDKSQDPEALAGSIGDMACREGLYRKTGVPCKIVKERHELIEIINNKNDVDIILITGSLYLIRDLHPDLA